MRSLKIDKVLLIFLALILLAGALIFSSAAFGLVARGATNMASVAFSHFVLGIGLGLVALLVGLFVDYRTWKKYAPHLFVAALIATALVFVPGLGFEHGGGKRWIHIFNVSLQPSEALKFGTILLAATYFAALKSKTEEITWGLGGFLALMALPAGLLLLQPDLGTLGVITISTFAVFIAAGARIRDIVIVVVLGVVMLGALAMVRPYVRDRVMTFINPSEGQHAQSYQIKQSLIAIGSGGLVGRGLGQGVQKFTYLPEPMGDSIFAVAGEELGFIGASGIVALFALFAVRGLTVAARAPDSFGSLLAVGISVYLGAEAFINIAAMLGLMPLTGIPLTFMSQGGSAMLVSLGAAGVLLNISRHKKR